VSATEKPRKGNIDVRSALYEMLISFAFAGAGYYAVSPEIYRPAQTDDLYRLENEYSRETHEAIRSGGERPVQTRKACRWPSRPIYILFPGRRP
jgi:hypothetical protein